jgi:uncharacterized membrane protein YedE/YeeE
MEMSDIQAQTTLVLWAAFAVAFLFGAVAQRTHFCTMGAISDAVNMGDWTRLRMWGMAAGIAMLGFYGMAALGWIDPLQTIHSGSRVRWLSALLGGALFGFGMVLASGCGSKTLVRIGAGNLKSLVVFFVMGLAAYATLSGVTAVLRHRSVDQVALHLDGSSALPLWLAGQWGAPGAALVLAGVVGLALIVWALASRDFRSSLDNWLAGIGIGATVVALWWVTGVLAFVPEHPETLETVFLTTNTGVMESLTFTAPMAYVLRWLIFFSDASQVITLGVVTVVGVVLGSLAYAMLSRGFHWEGFRGSQDTALHLVGAVCMGVGGVTAMGCTIGQGLSGLSTLSLGSLIAVAGIGLGAVGALRFQMWLLERG